MSTAHKNRPCGFCKKTCAEPKFLPCSHVFCKFCLNFKIITVPTNLQWEGFSCPSCNTYIKAIDSDQPLASWADQFPDTPRKRRPFRLPQSDDEVVTGTPSLHDSPRERHSTDSETGLPSPLASPGANSQEQVLPLSPAATSQNQILPLSPGTISPPVSPVTSKTMSPVPQENTMIPSTPNITRSASDSTDSVFTPPGSPNMSTSVSIPSPIHQSDSPTQAIPNEDSEQKMCIIHLWKPILVSCRKCDSLACGQCLTESHPTCKGEDFYPIPEASIFPSMSELEDEAGKVTPVSDMIISSSYQLQQMRELIRQKIKQEAMKIIQSMKQEEERMVKTVQRLYHDEIWRLKTGINPSESLLKEVQQLQKDAEDLSKIHSAAVLSQADIILDRQNLILGRLKAVDFACVPPEIEFVRDYNALTVTLGDLVIDQGFYPKHDIPDVPVEAALETLAVSEVGDSNTTNISTPKASSDQGGQQKSKTKSLMGRLLSPLQSKSKSKFYVKVPEL